MTTISIISPSFNQSSFIQRCLDSVAMQVGVEIEHIILDAGSTDGTREKILAYASNRPNVRVVFEPDNGQVDAINKGFRLARGQLLTWLNTDDYYDNSDIVNKVVHIFNESPDIDVVYGQGSFVSPSGELLRDAFINNEPRELLERFVVSVGILQPALFFRKNLIERVGLLDPHFNCAFDYELWIRFLREGNAKYYFSNRKFVNATFHENAKSSMLRFRQLVESVEVVKRHYGFSSWEWIARATECIIKGRNGIVDGETSSNLIAENLVNKVGELIFRRYNSSNSSRFVILESENTSERVKTRKIAQAIGIIRCDRVIVTTFDDAYLEQGCSLISSVRRYEPASTPIIVYSLKLSAGNIDFLSNLENVHVVQYPEESINSYPGFLNPKNYGYKCVAIHDAARFVDHGGCVLWVDAGVAVINSLDVIFNLINENHVFFVNHDDKSNWPFFNGTFCHPNAWRIMSATIPELLSEHLCSCLIGYRVGGRFESLFEDADKYSRIEDVVVWSKHPAEDLESSTDIVIRSSPLPAKARSLSVIREKLQETELQDVIASLGYLGHRQDQSIFSILAARYKAPINSAKDFCRSDDLSSEASKLNWASGSVAKALPIATEVPAHIVGSITYHHRGTFVDNYKIAKNRNCSSTLVVLGNGPSLKGFDFSRLVNFDCIGMNAAYRYWDQIGWYPRYYICLDKVVGLHHRDEILRLITQRELNKIEAFVLRKNLINELPGDVAGLACVYDFDDLRANINIFASMPITTGSHAALFGAFLGYNRMVLMGIDCNYVEKVKGVEERGGTVLELTETPEDNPNYFFSNYQVSGDKFNIPNPTPDLHLDSWRAIAPVLSALGVKIWNCSQISHVDAFQKRDFTEIEIEEVDQLGHQHSPFGRRSFTRLDCAEIDETKIVARLFAGSCDRVRTMIDVGAHHGTALAPFLDYGWKIFAFEPDDKNRAKLLERLAKHKNKHLVSLDTRCISNKSQKGMSFFTSEQSSGISGLSAFHETHVEAQKVDITTLTEFFEDKPLPVVDFLKIDTEGHDLFVLQGFPWERGKPAVIECEFEDTKTLPLGYTFHDLAHFLVDRGYTVYVSEWHPIIRYGIRHDWRQLMRYPCELADRKGWGNLLAFRDPIDEQALIAAVKKVLKVGDGDRVQKPATQPKVAAPALPAVPKPITDSYLGFRFEPGMHFTSIAPNQWRYTDSDAKQKLWVAAIDSPGPTAGRSFVGTLRLLADRAITLNVSLGRHGKSAYEGTSKRIVLSPGLPQIVKLDNKFMLEHQALKLQVEVLDLPGGGTAVMTMDTLGIFESQISVRDRLGVDNFNLVTANRFFREGDFSSALAIYLALSQQHPLQMYRDNAVMAAKKAGMKWVDDANQLT